MPARWVIAGLVVVAWGIPAIAGNLEGSPSSASPDLELLEFLGTWETDDGEWVDPVGLAETESSLERPASGEASSRTDEHKGIDLDQLKEEPFTQEDDDWDE